MLIPPRFLFRVAYPCPFIKGIPRLKGDSLLDLPAAARLDGFAGMDRQHEFADVRMAWNENGVGVQLQVRGKSEPIQADAARVRHSDGLTLWLDTRDARTGHRATRYCHQFHFLPSGGGSDGDAPLFSQAKINRAFQDAPMVSPTSVPMLVTSLNGGYRLEAFLPAAGLYGFDPDQSSRFGVFYVVRDSEKGEQTLGIGSEFPYWEDPSLWSVLVLNK